MIALNLSPQDEIERLQQRMEDGQRNMREEMRAREEAERRRRQERQEKQQREVARSPHKKKIRIRVEQG